MTTYFRVAATLPLALLSLTALAQEGGSISVSGNSVGVLNADEKVCLLAHPADAPAEAVELLLGSMSAVDFDLRIDAEQYDGELQWSLRFEDGNRNIQSLSQGDKIRLQAEIDFDSLTDDEYYQRHYEAEAVDHLSDAGFLSSTITVGDRKWSEYVAHVRANERFPGIRSENVSIAFDNISVVDSTADQAIESLVAKYSGPCRIAIYSE